MTWFLFYNRESSCLFWDESPVPPDPLCELLSNSNRPDESTARLIYDMNVRGGPAFETVYKPPEKAQTAPPAPPSQATDVLEPPRWPGGPLICGYENLPAFESLAHLDEFRQRNGIESLLGATMAIHLKWRCPRCLMIHVQTNPPQPTGSSSGATREYNHRPPQFKRDGLQPLEI